MELEVGMYVRFKDKRGNTYIRKIIEIPKDNRYASIYLDEEANYSKGLSPRNILKASHNIIDLIEDDDFIGYKRYGELCFDTAYSLPFFDKYKMFVNCNGEVLDLEDLNIVSILTKEQFKSMSYKVGD